MHTAAVRLLLALLVAGIGNVACRFEDGRTSKTEPPAPAGSGGGTSGAGGTIGGGGTLSGPPFGATGGGTSHAVGSPKVEDAGPLEGFGGDLGAHTTTLAMVDDVFHIVRRSDDEVIVSGSDDLVSTAKGDWVQCFNETSGLRWKRAFALGSPSDQGGGQAVVDGRGHTWFAGSFAGTLRVGATTVTSVVNPGEREGYVSDSRGMPSEDVFLAELDENGGLMSLRTFGGVGRQSLSGVKVDANDNLVLVGTFNGRMDLGSVELTSSGGSLGADLFVLKLSPEGEVLHVNQFAQEGLSVGDIALDSQNRVVIGGWSYPGGFLETPSKLELGSGWAFAVTEEGDISWHTSFGSLEGLSVVRVAIDSKDNAILSLTADPTALVFDAPPAPGGIALVKLDPAGDPLFVKRFGENHLDILSGIAVMPDDSLVLSGHFYDGIDFGGGRLEVHHPNAYDADAFAARLSAEGEHMWSLHAGGLDADWVAQVVLVRPDRVAVLGHFSTAMDWGDGPVLYQGGRYLAWLTP